MRFLIRSLIILVCWEAACHVFSVPPYLLAKPSEILRAAVKYYDELLFHSAWTLLEAGAGLAAAAVFSLATGVAFAVAPQSAATARPILVAIQATPIIAIAPLLTAWFGAGFPAKAACAFIVSFFPILVGTSAGLLSPEKDEIDMYRLMGASRWQLARRVRAPRALPYVFASLRVAAPLSIIGAIVGEFVGASRGLGFMILSSSYYLRTDRMFAAVLVCSAISLLALRVIYEVERRILFWEEERSRPESRIV